LIEGTADVMLELILVGGEDESRQARLQAGSPRPMSTLKKRSLSLAGHATSLALEPEFWATLEAMAAARGLSLAALIAEIDTRRGPQPLASACRIAALGFAEGRARQPR
jgi:predicted DNA-binding ribbon-helix-helix protein